MDVPEWREILRYLGQGIGLDDADIPNGEKMLEIVIKSYKREYDTLIQEMKALVLLDSHVYWVSLLTLLFQDSSGRISLTSDLWSDSNLRSFMAVTAHWLVLPDMDGNHDWKSALIAFRLVECDPQEISSPTSSLRYSKRSSSFEKYAVYRA